MNHTKRLVVADFLKKVANIDVQDEELEDVYENFKTDEFTKLLVYEYLAKHKHSEVLKEFVELCDPMVYSYSCLSKYPNEIVLEFIEPFKCGDTYEKPTLEEVFKQFIESDKNNVAVRRRHCPDT